MFLKIKSVSEGLQKLINVTHEDKTKRKSMFKCVFILQRKTRSLHVLDKFLAGFYISNKVNFQNYFVNKLIRLFTFEAIQKTRSTCFIGFKKLGYIALCFKPDKTLLLVFKHYLIRVFVIKIMSWLSLCCCKPYYLCINVYVHDV